MPICPQITNTPITVTYNSTDYTLDSVQDVQTTTTTFYASSSPNAQAVGDMWFDTSNGNKLYRWDGSSWVSVQDTAIATATSTANSALTSANGKNKVFYGSSTPTATSSGDLWFDGSNTNRPNQWNGSSWVPFGLGYLAVTSIDASNITTGTLTSRTIDNGSGTFHVDTAGNLTANSANITGTITSTAGTIGGFTINSGYLNYGGTYLNAGGGSGSGTYCIYDSTRGILLGGTANVGSIVVSTIYSWTSSGNITANGGSFGGALGAASASITGTVSANLLSTGSGSYYLNNSGTLNIAQANVSGYIYNAGHATTSSSANAYLNSSTGLLARSTSSLRYKINVAEQSIPLDSILSLTPKSFFDKGAFEEAGGKTDNLPRILGLIAEEVAEIPVLADLLMNKNEKGEPDSVNYDRVAVALLPLLKDLNDRINKLEGKQ